jgi:predicted ATPase
MPRSATVPRHPQTNLPEPVSELIGRDAEMGEILNLSAAHRLVTLTGAEGIGKTRLGIEAARQLLARFADGAWIVELAPLSDPALVPISVASVLGIEMSGGVGMRVANALRPKQLMLVLDNCEHVVGAATQMAEALMRANPEVRVIATSRDPLRVDGEWMLIEHAEKHSLGVWRTYGLAVQGRIDIESGAASDSVAFIRSALADLRETPLDMRAQLYLVWLAEALGKAAQASAGLSAIDQALERAERTEERWYLPELRRLRGELLLQAGTAAAFAEANECFVRSRQLAQEQRALSWELRCATSQARLWRDQGRREEARQLLASVYDRFTEGFATRDLMRARALLDDLT